MLEAYLAGHPVRAELAEAKRRGDLPEEGHHIYMLDETLHKVSNTVKQKLSDFPRLLPQSPNSKQSYRQKSFFASFYLPSLSKRRF